MKGQGRTGLSREGKGDDLVQGGTFLGGGSRENAPKHPQERGVRIRGSSYAL